MKPSNRRKKQKLKARGQQTRYTRWMVRWKADHPLFGFLCDSKTCEDDR